MKILLAYSSLTGNTQKIMKAAYEVLRDSHEARLFPVAEAPRPNGEDLVLLGFWVNRGQADEKTNAYMETLPGGQKVAYLGTLGAYPDSGHALKVKKNVEERLAAQDCRGGFLCQGAVTPKLVQAMGQAEPDSELARHHQMTPERQARLTEAAKHPDEDDLNRARDFVRQVAVQVESEKQN